MRAPFMLVTALALALCACGQPSVPTPSGDAGTEAAVAAESTPETDILRTAAMYEAYEVEASAIAQSSAVKQSVRDFAIAAASEHDAAVAAIASAAQAANLAAPDATLDENRQAYLTMLRDNPQPSFDTVYTSQQTLMHISTIGAFDQFLAANPESALRPWAEANAARMRAKLDAVRAMAG